MLILKPGREKTEIVFRHRESRFSPDFLKGLVAALLFHMFLFGLLRITSHSPPLEPLLPFTAAVAEIGARAVVQVTSPEFFIVSFEEILPRWLPDGVPEPTFSHHKEERNRGLVVEPDFSPLEKIPYIPLKEEEY